MTLLLMYADEQIIFIFVTVRNANVPTIFRNFFSNEMGIMLDL